MRRQLAFHFLAALLSLVISAVCLEGFVRVFVDDGMQYDLEMWKYARDVKRVSADPLLAHEHAPDREARLMGVEVKTNSMGLRDREYSYERAAGSLRIMMLGDSFTEGWGTPYEDTFSKRLERMFSAEGVKAEVINSGVGNYTVIQEVEYFLTRGYKYDPDIVVLNYFIRDAEPVPHDVPPGFFMRHCYSCVFLMGRVDALLRELFLRQDYVRYYLSLYQNGKAKDWLDAKAAFSKLADYCKAHEVKLLVVNLPELHDVQHYKFQVATDLVHRAADEAGVPFVDALPYLAKEELLEAVGVAARPACQQPGARADRRGRVSGARQVAAIALSLGARVSGSARRAPE